MVQQISGTQGNVLDSLLQSNFSLFSNVLLQKDKFNLQVIYTQIDRDEQNTPTFTDYKFNLEDPRYFYPASTVKMPVAFLALEKLNQLNIFGLNRSSAMITDSNFSGQKVVLTHPVAEESKPSVEQYVKEIFLVSDNEAFNRLYEFVGPENINRSLHQKGYTGAEIRHRLSIPLSDEENRHTNAIQFYDTAGNLLHQQPAAYNAQVYNKRNNQLGKGYYKNGVLVNEPFDFSAKNRFPLQDLHQVLRSVLFPENVPAKSRFNLTTDDYAFLYRWMSSYPLETTYPQYDSSAYWNSYVKFLLFGSAKDKPPKEIRIYNKVGDAYGFLIDVAYVVDFERKIEFMLSATLLCNNDEIFNNDKYEYDEIGFPFMKNLGQVVYDYEKNKVKKHQPNLGRFIVQYDQE
jgi:hypothetical protein